MTQKELRIVYMGTPHFAVEPLRSLVENGYNVVGVITMPDKPAGRGYKIQYSPVKEYAIANNLPLLQPEKLKDEAFLDALRKLDAQLQIVVAFRMLPEVVWDMPPMGTFNLHASLLPEYRGAAPINWAIINGENQSGVTTFLLTHEIDKGAIIAQQSVEITHTDDASTLHDKLMKIGAELVINTTRNIMIGTFQPVAQEVLIKREKELSPAPKIFKEDCRIAWDNTVLHLYNFIRGLSPYPAAHTLLVSPNKEEVPLKVFASTEVYAPHNHPIGSIHTDGKNYMDVAVQDGYISITSLQIAGKKRLNVIEFLRGFALDNHFICR